MIALTGPDSTPAGLPTATPALAGPVPAGPAPAVPASAERVPAGPVPAEAVPAEPRRGHGLPAEPVLALPWALLAAVAGGLALTAAFPPVGVWPLAPLGPALLCWRCRAVACG